MVPDVGRKSCSQRGQGNTCYPCCPSLEKISSVGPGKSLTLYSFQCFFFFPLTALLEYKSHTIHFTQLKCVIQCIHGYATVTTVNLRTFFSLLLSKRNAISFSYHLPSSSSHLPALCNHWSASCLRTLLYSGRLHEWRHIRGLLGLAPFTSRVSKVHPSYSTCRDLIPFLRLRNASSCGCATFLSSCQLMHI